MELMENSSENIAELTRDYVGHYLRKHGFECEGLLAVRSPNPFMTRLKHSIRLLCDEFQHNYRAVFTELCNEIEVTPSKAKESYFSVVRELFQDPTDGVTVKWGRLVALFALAGALSRICISKGNPDLVNYIIQWTNAYIMENLISWIETNDGWNVLIMVADQTAHKKEAQLWPGLKNVVCGLAASALGLFTLKAFLTSKS